MNKQLKQIIAAATIAAALTTTLTPMCFAASASQPDLNFTLSSYDYNLFDGQVELMAQSTVYTGEAITPQVTLYDGETELVEGVDYDVRFEDNINAGTQAKAIVTYKGNYEGEKIIYFTILPKTLSTNKVNIDDIGDFTYSGSEHKPEPTIQYKNTTLVKDVDYTLSYSDNVNKGTATINVEFINNYTGNATAQFTINSKTLSQNDVTFTHIDDMTYTGSPLTPEPVIKYEDVTLVKDTDYTLSYSDNTGVGTATVNVEFIGNYIGNASTNFEIVSKQLTNSDLTISAIDDQVFTGLDIEPTPTIKYGEVTLVKDIDYTLSYENNKNVGVADINVNLKGNYSGNGSSTFNIVKKALSRSDVTITEIVDQIFTGEEIKPTVQISVGGTELIEGTDFTVQYTDNVSVGTGHANIEFIGNYSGETTTDFNIISLTITQERVNIAAVDDVIFKKTAYTPEPEVKLGDTVLVKNRDFEYQYENNVNAGTATIKIVGIGNFDGSATTTFTIKPRNGSMFTYYLVFFEQEEDDE